MTQTSSQNWSPRGVQRISRRAFLLGIGGVVLAGAGAVCGPVRQVEAAGAGAAPPDTTAPPRAAEALVGDRAALFEPYVGQHFHISETPTDVQEIELLKVLRGQWRASPPGRTDRPTPRGQTFSLIFRGVADRALPQGVYRLDHDRLGALRLLIVPLRPGADGQRYEAAFNLLEA